MHFTRDKSTEPLVLFRVIILIFLRYGIHKRQEMARIQNNGMESVVAAFFFLGEVDEDYLKINLK